MEDKAFRRAFSALAGEASPFKPFPWQTALWKRLSRGDIPARLDVPTGLGKTSVMALWLIARAGGAPLPRRLVYVVDRRTVVDQSTDFAVGLRSNLPAARTAVQAGWPARLPISTLRGGFADNREWLGDPSKAAIVIGTVDMIGSRLLFEGYGVSRRMRPMHAGLLGADALVLLDEAHLSIPFLRLIEAVAEMRRASDAPIPAFRVMSLSATGAAAGADRAFRLTPEDREHREVRRRLDAPKCLHLEPVPGAGAAAFSKRALELAERGPARIVVFHDSRQEAVKIADALENATKKTGAPVERLTGARRGWERDRAADRLAELGFLAGAEAPRERPAFLVTTSAGEVGIDLDADHMVCDLVPWERMVQRLGRVNRRGRGRAKVVVLDPGPDPKRPDDAPRLDATRALLAALPPAGEDDAVQAGPGAIEALKEVRAPEEFGTASTALPLHPPLAPATVEAWSLTNLHHHPGRPQVAPWLRGWVEDDPQTTLVWRRWLPARRAGDEPATLAPGAAGFFEDAPIHASERLETRTAEALDWLLRRAAALTTDAEVPDGRLAPDDLAAALLDAAGEPVPPRGWTMTLRGLAALSGPEAKLDSAAKRRKSALFSSMIGATLVVDARLGGLAEGLLDAKAAGPVASADWAGTTDSARWRASLRDPDDPAAGPLIGFRIDPARVEAGTMTAPALPTAEAGEWRETRLLATRLDAEGEPLEGLVAFRWRGAIGGEDSRSRAGKPQKLDDHTRMVVEEAERIGAVLDLPADLREALVTAARLHDRGKAVRVWQRAMRAPPDGPWAKTKGGNPKELNKYRHEFGSLIKAEEELPEGDTRDLILHLIAAHHGNARPVLSPASCDEAPPSALAARVAEAALRFARLQRRYGPWGLAWLEALLRAADQRASALWEEQSRG